MIQRAPLVVSRPLIGPLFTPIGRKPRSLSVSLDPTQLTDVALELEIELIHRWLEENPGSTVEANNFSSALMALEAEEAKRTERAHKREAQLRALSDAALVKKIAHFRAWLKDKPATGPADRRQKNLERHEQELARRLEKPVTSPRRVAEAISMLEQAEWWDQNVDAPAARDRVLRLVDSVEAWLVPITRWDHVFHVFHDLPVPDTAYQRAMSAYNEVLHLHRLLRISMPLHAWYWRRSIDWINSKWIRMHLEVVAGERTLQSTEIPEYHKASRRAMYPALALYGAPIAIGATVATGGVLLEAGAASGPALMGWGMRLAPRVTIWAARNPVLATEIGITGRLVRRRQWSVPHPHPHPRLRLRHSWKSHRHPRQRPCVPHRSLLRLPQRPHPPLRRRLCQPLPPCG